MAKRISIPKRAYKAIELLVQNAPEVEKLREVLADSELGYDVEAVSQAFSSQSSLSPDDTQLILSEILSLQATRRRLNLSAKQLVDEVSRSLRESAPDDWKKANLEKWDSASEIVEELMSPDHPLASVGKVMELAFDRENVLTEARILTDVRPVFTDDGGSITLGIITHELIVEFFEGGERRRTHFALDTSDIRTLRVLCERAEAKALTAKEMMEAAKWHVHDPGDRR